MRKEGFNALQKVMWSVFDKKEQEIRVFQEEEIGEISLKEDKSLQESLEICKMILDTLLSDQRSSQFFVQTLNLKVQTFLESKQKLANFAPTVSAFKLLELYFSAQTGEAKDDCRLDWDSLFQLQTST